MMTQEQFEKFVEDYNEDYLFLLKRASQLQYKCLLSSFLVLKDLYNAIMVMYDSGNYTFSTLPHPPTVRVTDALLKELGFGEEEIQHISGFLEYVKATEGRKFEDCMEQEKSVVCAKEAPPVRKGASNQDRK
ncbi:MAG TPA: hypothetical protein VNO70_26815 [Blastocatellia bacterium]|nr:hypothetical protein [Blastocatellia bacterium]